MTAGPSRSPTPSPSPTPSSPPQRQAGSWSPPAVCREGCNWSCDGDATPAWPRAIVPPSHRSARRRRHREVDGHRGDRTAEDPTADRSRSALRRRSTSCRRPAATDPHVPSAPAPAGAAAGPFQRRRCCTQASELPTSEGRLLVGQPDGERGRVLPLLPYGSYSRAPACTGGSPKATTARSPSVRAPAASPRARPSPKAARRRPSIPALVDATGPRLQAEQARSRGRQRRGTAAAGTDEPALHRSCTAR